MSNNLAAACATGAYALFLASSASADGSQPQLTKVASFKHQVTGVTVTKDNRIFVNFPRWTEDTEVSVAELKYGKPVPYPNAEWNSWRNALKDKVEARTHFVCVQATVADHAGNIWVVDAGAPGYEQAGAGRGQAGEDRHEDEQGGADDRFRRRHSTAGLLRKRCQVFPGRQDGLPDRLRRKGRAHHRRHRERQRASWSSTATRRRRRTRKSP